MSSYVGLKIHACGSEPRNKPSTYVTYIGTYISIKLKMLELPDKSYDVSFNITFPPNIREIILEFWVVLNEEIRKISVKRGTTSKYVPERYDNDDFAVEDEDAFEPMFLCDRSEDEEEEPKKKKNNENDNENEEDEEVQRRIFWEIE